MNANDQIREIRKQIEIMAADIDRISDMLFSSERVISADRGGVEVAIQETPFRSENHIYILCRRGHLPHRKVGRLYEFSRSELRAWKDAGSPQPAQEWAEQFRAEKTATVC